MNRTSDTGPNRLPGKPSMRTRGLVLAVAFLPVAACTTAAPVSDSAAVDESAPCFEDRAALLALDQEAFDQDMTGGWRPVAARPECRGEAADLLNDYREQQIAAGAGHGGLDILYWHEGQLRAGLDDPAETARAIALFEQSRKQEDSAGWNLYVDGTIAFLEQDADGLEAARSELAALPQPDWFAEAIANTEERYGFTPKWPPNLDVLDAFHRCFGKTYNEGYSTAECRNPPPEPDPE